MKNIKTYKTRFFSILLLGLSFMAPTAVSAAAAGKVVFSTGSTKAVNSSGVSRNLRRGDEVFSGDSLQTAARSRLQVSLSDGAYVSVQPGSEYKIEDYNYSGKADGTERAFYRLLKGGIRAVTGYIGKRNRDAYKVNTAVATIGIRGTGHNTRICAGDCPGKKDGLYHNTWEGVTTVDNDKDSAEVPAGKGVFVKDIESKIQSTSQPSSATAVRTAKKEKEDQEEEEDSSLVSSANQRTGEDGLQRIVVENEEVRQELDNPFGDPTSSTTFGGIVVLAVGPENDPNQLEGEASALFDATVFKSSDGKPIAFFGKEEDDDNNTAGVPDLFETFATIDAAAALGADDETLAETVKIFLDAADRDQIDLFLENPASVGEFQTTDEGLSLGRWTDGNVLSVIKNLTTGAIDETGVDELTDFQSIHFIYGAAPGPIPTSGGASYNFTAGTASSSTSGATTGNGAITGFISVSFSTSDAFLNMDVDHNGSLYSLSGGLTIDGESLFDTNSVIASTGTAGSACNPSCNAIIDGGFAGPVAPSMPNMPNNIGIEYEILETDIITGVAGFSYQLTP